MMFKITRSTTPIRDELANLAGISAWCNLVGGLLLVSIWTIFNYVDVVMLYMYYAAPLITTSTLMVMLVLGISSLVGFGLDIIVWALAIGNKRIPRALLIVSALPGIIIPPVGMFFGTIKLSLAGKLEGILDDRGTLFDVTSIKQLLEYNALHAIITCAIGALFIPAFYIIPLEFANSEKFFWLRLNIYSLHVVVIFVFALLVGVIVVSAILVAKQQPLGRKFTWAACIIMLFAFPVGSYLAGVIYRNYLKKRNT